MFYSLVMKKFRGKAGSQESVKQIGHPLPPRRYEATAQDRRKEFLILSTIKPPEAKVQRDFIAAKLKLLRTHPAIHPADRRAAVEGFKALVAPELDLEEEGPVPGGVGYGIFYNAAFKSNFTTGTAISWEIICPQLPAGNVDTWLYLTATNRSSKGVEAFVAYQGQQPFSFNIYDWSLPVQNRWQPAVPFNNLAQYLGNDASHGNQFQIIALINSTSVDDATQGNWVNEVMLLDFTANQWHSVYKNSYPATLQDQIGDFVGSWAPIVETFQDSYSGTNLMGSLNAQILTRDAAGNWGSWMPLAAAMSDLRTDNKGFTLSFLDPNYSWAVHS